MYIIGLIIINGMIACINYIVEYGTTQCLKVVFNGTPRGIVSCYNWVPVLVPVDAGKSVSGVRKTTAARSKAPRGVITCHGGLHTSRLGLAPADRPPASRPTSRQPTGHPSGRTKLRSAAADLFRPPHSRTGQQLLNATYRSRKFRTDRGFQTRDPHAPVLRG